MTRAALYARYSTDKQSERSVADQLQLCRPVAAEQGAHVVREDFDEGLSGFDGARPGLAALLAAVRRGEVDLVIAEHSDRLARDGEKSWQVFNLFRAHGVRYVTVQEGEVGIVHQGVSSLVSELKGEEVRLRTRRGLKGVVADGRSAGGLSYGYRVKREYDEAGERRRGLLEIDAAQAQVVRRILREYAAGASPLALAAALNAEGVPGPRGGPWNHSTIVGSAARGTGLLHNELYIGVRVWGRRTFVKDRATGARRGRDAADPAQVVREPVPELRIVDDELWARVRARHAELSKAHVDADGRRVGNGKRPKRFLSGLIRCGLCGGPMTKAGPKEALRCATRAYRKGCDNTAAPGYPGLEARVIAAVKANLLHPDVIEHTIRRIQDGLAGDRKDAARRRAKLSAELAETRRRAERLLDQVADGVLTGAAVRDKLAALETRRAQLEADLAAKPEPEIIPLGPSVAGLYRRHVEQLSAALDAPPEDAHTAEDRAAVRSLIDRIVFTPRPDRGHGQYDLAIEGDLAPLLQLGAAQNAKTPGAEAPGVMRVMGAGTRVHSRHSLRYEQAA